MSDILLVVGTRPEAIKMLPLYSALKRDPYFDVKICVTGQHKGMLDQILSLYDVVPDFDLALMKPNQDLYDISIGVLNGLRNIFASYHPDVVLVHGDTTTCFAASVAAFYSKIKVAHVEAGLRTGFKYSPFPEEINRRMAGVIADIHFAPTESAASNLIAEGVSEKNIYVTGNTVIDALMYAIKRLQTEDYLASEVHDIFKSIDFGKKSILITAHRRENFGEGLKNICSALKKIASRGVNVVFPVHPNPNIRSYVYSILEGVENVFLMEPLDYLPFVYIQSKVDLILTDSGGIQEEAPSLGKPVLVLRQNTERPEAVAAGTVKLIGTDEQAILNSVFELLLDEDLMKSFQKKKNPYGDGDAVVRIVSILKNIFEN